MNISAVDERKAAFAEPAPYVNGFLANLSQEGVRLTCLERIECGEDVYTNARGSFACSRETAENLIKLLTQLLQQPVPQRQPSKLLPQ